MMGVGMKESTRSREAYFLDFAASLREKCKIPLMVTGGFRSLSASNEALASNELDIVGYARPFLMDLSFPQGFLNGDLERVDEPSIPVIDKNNVDAVEAGYYDLQIRRLSQGKKIPAKHSALRLGLHLPMSEMRKGIRNWILR